MIKDKHRNIIKYIPLIPGDSLFRCVDGEKIHQGECIRIVADNRNKEFAKDFPPEAMYIDLPADEVFFDLADLLAKMTEVLNVGVAKIKLLEEENGKLWNWVKEHKKEIGDV